MYKILIKHNTNVSKSNTTLWYEYGSTVTSNTTKFTPFETNDVEILKLEILKLSGEFGHENIMAIKELDVVYDVEIENEEENTTTEPNEPTIPDDTNGDNSSGEPTP